MNYEGEEPLVHHRRPELRRRDAGSVLQVTKVTEHEPPEHEPPTPNALEVLSLFSAPGCLYNATERLDPPKCAPETRENILRIIEKWIVEDKHGKAALMWLFGAAGAGKSAIAQTMVENCIPKGLHAASFFFSSSSHARLLLPTLIYQVVKSDEFDFMRPLIEETILDNPDIFQTRMRNQLNSLLIKPLEIYLNARTPSRRAPFQIRQAAARLIVIDGLDECSSVEEQKEILRIFAEALPLLRYPFRFLILSRPEAHIVDTFRHHAVFKNVEITELDLGNDVDANNKSIDTFLRQSFDSIRASHRLAKDFGPEWPSQDAIDYIIKKASGNFIYAANVIKYVEHRQFRPDQRLAIVLGLEMTPDNDNPFAHLDALYSRILVKGLGLLIPQQWAMLGGPFGILYLAHLQQHGHLIVSRNKLKEYLGLDQADPPPILDRFRSLLEVPNDLDAAIKVYQPDFLDFLFDKNRSKQYCLANSTSVIEKLGLWSATESDLTFLIFLSSSIAWHQSPEPIVPSWILQVQARNSSSVYLPFIYTSFIQGISRTDSEAYSRNIAHLKSLLGYKATLMKPRRPVLPAFRITDLGEVPANDCHFLCASFFAEALPSEDPEDLLSSIRTIARDEVSHICDTTLALKHILLAVLPLLQPTHRLYSIYAGWASELQQSITDSRLNAAIYFRIRAFLKLPQPPDCEIIWESCRREWALVHDRIAS